MKEKPSTNNNDDRTKNQKNGFVSCFHVYLLFFSSQCVHVDVLLHVEELEAEVIPIGEHKQKGVSAEGRKIHLN